MSEELKAAQARIACLEGEIAKRDEELAACRVAVENCEAFRVRIAELEDLVLSLQCKAIESDDLRAELSALKAQGVVKWPEADEIMKMAFEEGQPADDASGYCFELEEFDLFIERLMSDVARLNAAPVQQVSVPQCVFDLFEAKQAHVNAVDAYNARLAFVREHMPFGTSVDPEYQIMEEADRKVRNLVWPMFNGLRDLAAAPAAPAADVGLVEARKANNELVNDLHVMTNKCRQLVDALTYLRECLDPEDYMGEISMHDFIDDALVAHRAKGVV